MNEMPFEMELIFAPISESDPCGPDLRYEPAFDAIVEAARDESDGLPMGIWQRKLKKADWGKVSTECYKILTRRSKDLRVAGWMLEALVHLRGAEGLFLGASIFAGLAMKFWDDVHPRIVDDEIEARLCPFLTLGERFAPTILVVMEPHLSTPLRKAEAGQILEGAIAELVALDNFIQGVAAHAAPNLRPLIDAVSALVPTGRVAMGVTADRRHITHPIAEREDFSGAGALTREGAYAQLEELAKFLALTEPHSPVPTILAALANWRDLKFHELAITLPSDSTINLYSIAKAFGSMQDSRMGETSD